MSTRRLRLPPSAEQREYGRRQQGSAVRLWSNMDVQHQALGRCEGSYFKLWGVKLNGSGRDVVVAPLSYSLPARGMWVTKLSTYRKCSSYRVYRQQVHERRIDWERGDTPLYGSEW
jgi:hypothetical protein